MNELLIAKKHPEAIIPTKESENAGFDLYALDRKNTIVIEPGTISHIETGIALVYTDDYFAKIMDRGSYGSINVTATAGVGDSGFRDSYKVFLSNLNKDKYVILTAQSNEEIENSNVFNLNKNKFETITPEQYILECLNCKDKDSFYIPDKESIFTPKHLISKDRCFIKDLNNAITQFIMLPVPKFKTIEIDYEEVLKIPSERGLGMLGSSNK